MIVPPRRVVCQTESASVWPFALTMCITTVILSFFFATTLVECRTPTQTCRFLGGFFSLFLIYFHTIQASVFIPAFFLLSLSCTDWIICANKEQQQQRRQWPESRIQHFNEFPRGVSMHRRTNGKAHTDSICAFFFSFFFITPALQQRCMFILIFFFHSTASLWTSRALKSRCGFSSQASFLISVCDLSYFSNGTTWVEQLMLCKNHGQRPRLAYLHVFHKH